MYVKTRKKTHNASNGKCGFTLVELCVVLALVAILGTMVVSFSVMFSEYTNGVQSEYLFLEHTSALNERLSDWVAENDTTSAEYSVIPGGGTLSVGGETVYLSEGVLYLGSQRVEGFNEIDRMSFYTNGALIKCTTYHNANDGDLIESSFVISLRCGIVTEVSE